MKCGLKNLNLTDTTTCGNGEYISAIKVNDKKGVFSIANLDDFDQTLTKD
jgi:hypothetical protein